MRSMPRANLAAPLFCHACTLPPSFLPAVQYALFASQMIFILARIKSMTRWRGRGALEMPADRQLFVDRPLRDKVGREGHSRDQQLACDSHACNCDGTCDIAAHGKTSQKLDVGLSCKAGC